MEIDLRDPAQAAPSQRGAPARAFGAAPVAQQGATEPGQPLTIGGGRCAHLLGAIEQDADGGVQRPLAFPAASFSPFATAYGRASLGDTRQRRRIL